MSISVARKLENGDESNSKSGLIAVSSRWLYRTSRNSNLEILNHVITYIYVLFTPLDAGNVKHMIYQKHLWVNNAADLVVVKVVVKDLNSTFL